MNINWGKKNECLQSEIQILGRKTESQGKALYLVKWLKKNQITWQPLANLKDYIQLIRKFQRQYQQNMKNWPQIFQADKQKSDKQELQEFGYNQKQSYNNSHQQNKFYKQKGYIQSSNKKYDNANLYSNMFSNTSMYNYKKNNKYLNMVDINNKPKIYRKEVEYNKSQKEGNKLIREQSSTLNLLLQQGQIYNGKNQLKLTQTQEEKKLTRDEEEQKTNPNQISRKEELSKPLLRNQKLVLLPNNNMTQIETQTQNHKKKHDCEYSNQLISFYVQNVQPNIAAQGFSQKNEINNQKDKRYEIRQKIIHQRPNNSQVIFREENIQMFKALKKIVKSNKKMLRLDKRMKLRQCYLLQQKKITDIKKISYMQQAWWAIVLTEDGDQITILRDQLRVTNPDLLLSYYQAQYQNKLKNFSITM